MQKMKLIPADEMTFVLKPYAPPLEKEMAKILTNPHLSPDIKMQLYQQAVERAKGLKIPKKKYVQVEKPVDKNISVQNIENEPPEREEINLSQLQSPVPEEISADATDRNLLIDIYQMLKNTPTLLSAAIHEASRMTASALQQQYSQRKSSSIPSTSKNFTITPSKLSSSEESEEEVLQTVKKKKSPTSQTRQKIKARRTLPFQSSTPQQEYAAFSADDRDDMDDFQHLEQPNSIFHVDMPAILRNKKIIPKTYMPQVHDLYRKLKYNIPDLNYAIATGQLIMREQPVEGAFITHLLTDMVRDTQTFRNNPDYAGVHEIIDIMRDKNFPPDEIRNPTFRKKYEKALRGEENPKDQSVYASLSPVSQAKSRKNRVEVFKRSIGVLPPLNKKRKAEWEGVK